MGIRHIDELIFDSPETLRQIVDGLQQKTIPVFLKWDGNPSFVVGTDDQGFFLAFKNGYYRKEQKLYRCPNFPDIESVPLRNTMALLFGCFHEFYKSTSCQMTLGGDFVFDYMDQWKVRPNTVQYILSTDEALFDAVIGVAIHTVNGKISSFVHQNYSDIFWIDTKPKIDMKVPNLELINDCSGVTNTYKTKFFKWVNSSLKQDGNDLSCLLNLSDNNSNFFDMINNLKRLWDWKRALLNSLQIDYQFLTATTEHEGLVIDTPSGLYKIVDRQQFSARNFANHRK